MRWLFFLLSLTTAGSFAQAQVQERKLADRLLRPDMSLSNPAQNKKFVAAGETPADKKFAARQFYSGDPAPTRSFWGARSFLSKTFGTGKFARAEAAASAKASAELAYASTQFQERKSSFARVSARPAKTVRVRDYTESRPFLIQGTRQKQLDRHNRPMTIDEVRELLNTSR